MYEDYETEVSRMSPDYCYRDRTLKPVQQMLLELLGSR